MCQEASYGAKGVAYFIHHPNAQLLYTPMVEHDQSDDSKVRISCLLDSLTNMRDTSLRTGQMLGNLAIETENKDSMFALDRLHKVSRNP